MKILRINEVRERTGLGVSTIYRISARSVFRSRARETRCGLARGRDKCVAGKAPYSDQERHQCLKYYLKTLPKFLNRSCTPMTTCRPSSVRTAAGRCCTRTHALPDAEPERVLLSWRQRRLTEAQAIEEGFETVGDRRMARVDGGTAPRTVVGIGSAADMMAGDGGAAPRPFIAPDPMGVRERDVAAERDVVGEAGYPGIRVVGRFKILVRHVERARVGGYIDRHDGLLVGEGNGSRASKPRHAIETRPAAAAKSADSLVRVNPG